MSEASLDERALGAILGAAIADALGAPVEFDLPATRIAQYGLVRELMPSYQGPAGSWTDDTQMVVCIMEAVRKAGKLDLDAIAAEFVTWFDSSPPDIGLQTREVCALAWRGMPMMDASRKVWEDSGKAAAGNGSVMRSGPVAVYCHKLDDWRPWSRQVSALTHWDPRCQDCCALVDGVLIKLFRGEEVSFETIAALAEGLDESVVEAVSTLPRLGLDDLQGGGYVIDTTLMALWALLSFDDFEEGVATTVTYAYDADTVGAVAGCLLGAKYGLEGIPRRWLQQLQQTELLEAGVAALLAAAPCA